MSSERATPALPLALALPDMQQSNVIFAFLFAAFLVFITSRGELPKYAGLFF
jgi:hypothetical protein